MRILWMNGSQPYKCQTCRAGRTPAASHQGPASESEWFSCRKTLSDLFAALHALNNVHIEKTPRNLPQLGVAILYHIFKMNNKSVSHSHLINIIDKFIPCKLFHSATHPIRHQICPTHYHETGKILKSRKLCFLIKQIKYFELLSVEELLSEVGVSRPSRQIQTSHCHPCLGCFSFILVLQSARPVFECYNTCSKSLLYDQLISYQSGKGSHLYPFLSLSESRKADVWTNSQLPWSKKSGKIVTGQFWILTCMGCGAKQQSGHQSRENCSA